MPERQIDPARLEGEALRRWYLRSPAEIERERQATANAGHAAFFGADHSDEGARGFGATQDPSPAGPQFAGSAGTLQASVDAHPGFVWRSAGPGRWRRDEARGSAHSPRPVPLPSPKLGPKDDWSHPVPLLPVQLPPGGARPVPLSPIYPNDLAPSHFGSTTALPAQSTAYRSQSAPAPKRVSQPAPAAQSQRHGIWIAGRQSGDLDPSRTDVYQTGPDGKLHPVPGWRTTGPFEFADWSKMFDWSGVGGDLADITSGALDFMSGGGLAGEALKGLRYKIGQDVIRGIFHGHHSWPKFMGGPTEQELTRLYKSLHVDFHSELATALKEAGFPRIGGKGGSIEDWARYYSENAGKADEAIEILRRTTRDFDRRNGTNISKYLEGTLTGSKPSVSPPPR